MAIQSKLGYLAGGALSFTALAVLIFMLLVLNVVSPQLALLMLVGLVGLYFGFGVLIAVYRFISKLD